VLKVKHDTNEINFVRVKIPISKMHGKQEATGSSPVMSSSENLGISIFQGFFVPS